MYHFVESVNNCFCSLLCSFDSFDWQRLCQLSPQRQGPHLEKGFTCWDIPFSSLALPLNLHHALLADKENVALKGAHGFTCLKSCCFSSGIWKPKLQLMLG